jgi:aspartate racemase
VFGRQGLSVVSPQPDEQELIHSRYIGELIEGVFRTETRDLFLSIIETMSRRDQLDAVVLAGTELPLLLRAEAVHGIPLLDTTGIHVDAAIRHLLG